MTILARSTVLAAAAAAVLAIAQPAPAAAQGLPVYCDHMLFTNSLYTNVRSDGRTAEVDYHGQFQNRDPQGRTLIARMTAVERINNFVVRRPIGTFTLTAYQQQDVRFLTLHVTNPSGSGAPSAVDVARQIRFTCSFG